MSTLLATIIILAVIVIGALVLYMALGPGGHPWGPPNGNNDPELAPLLAAAQTQTASLVSLLGAVNADLQPLGQYASDANVLQASAVALGLKVPDMSHLAGDLAAASQGVQTYQAKFGAGATQLAGFTVDSDVGSIMGAIASMPFAMQQNLPPVQDGFSLVATDLNLLWNTVSAQVQVMRNPPAWIVRDVTAVRGDEANVRSAFTEISTAASLAWSALQALLSNLEGLGRRRASLVPCPQGKP